MRKTLMIVSALAMILAMVIGSAGIVSAGKPSPSLNLAQEALLYDDAGIYGTPGEVYIACFLSWEAIGAWGYKVEWGPTATNATLYSLTAGGKKLRNYSGWCLLSIPESSMSMEYSINTTLLDRKGDPIGWWDADTVYPDTLPEDTTAIYAQHFSGVASSYLPFGWSANRTDLCYVAGTNWAGGVAPELEIAYDDTMGDYDYSDYWVSTPEIQTTSATSNLTLSFDHYFSLWEYAEEAFPYTIVVEVSANNGTAWTATSFVDSPNLTKYPSEEIGPEKVNIDLSTYAGQTIMIRWRIYGYTYMMNYWSIDNVVLTGY